MGIMPEILLTQVLAPSFVHTRGLGHMRRNYMTIGGLVSQVHRREKVVRGGRDKCFLQAVK